MFLEYRKELRVIYNNLGALVSARNMNENYTRNVLQMHCVS